ncbi:peptidase C14 [Cordyceps fumosorosea ARSEF 2679]|uniref:Peptidase C14 n=1 Tax=Cordyceps fumosorosea (strain ARSEF 2679) TaxID=1081104 RepID=A0A167MPL9_CORFA|nr:peptidase C14 [Cordyceps fumosorosea ARSEF 2679]OAA54616.1 peptidase C14 [Cordyceps fumosorosea ARSEF 2679]
MAHQRCFTGRDAKFEIIAVPGLGAHPYHTWEARKIKGSNEAEYQIVQPARVHLLNDLLADEFPDARILNFAHDSNWLIDAPVKTTEEIGKCLLKEIKANRSSPHLPIIFIGHSLGGIIVKQALCGSDSRDIVDATAGIIFLGAPHQGSSVSVAGAVLASVTGILGSDTTLLLSLQNHDAQLSNLADAFGSRIAPNERRPQKVPIISFYETKKTYLLGLSLGVVVSRDSATVHADADKRHSIETDHSGLNKCGGPSDTLFTELAAAIRRLKTPSLLEQADTLIRDKRYTADKLKIERLSGELLPMEQCYINLAIVEQSGPDAGHSTKKEDTTPSPFSIFIRQKVETPDKTMQVELATIFNERKGSDGQPMHPRRILIRGRAGVGKTTLCKKIVHEFTKVTWVKWNELFDRVLWVPLRNLKLPERRKKAQYTLEHLFSHEFLLPTDGPNLARALSCALETKSSKTLFLLDGLDEVSQDLTGNSSMACFLAELLNQPNVVITSRPSAKPPPNLDLELETIGFGPDQLNEYIEKSFTNPKTSVIDRTKKSTKSSRSLKSVGSSRVLYAFQSNWMPFVTPGMT